MPLQILLHSSKTMRSNTSQSHRPLDIPTLLPQARQLVDILQYTNIDQLKSLMKLSDKKANEVVSLFHNWSTQKELQTPAIDTFIGDIYSGLQVQTWSDDDRAYAHQYLLILSGLYGGLRACDGVMPYRLEMGYKLPGGKSLYQFWGDSISTLLANNVDCIVNLSAVEYTKALLPYTKLPVITPKFLTVSPKTSEPTFVTVHTKIARGAFAHWLITNRINTPSELSRFSDLNYRYDASASTKDQPVFICDTFGGLGMSVRLTT